MEREITITVTDDEARRIEERVASGEYESASELAHAALATFVRADNHGPHLPDELLRHLIEEDEADPWPDVDIDEAFAQVYRHIEELAAKRDGRS
jgi:Arc/MetJ-type ribon-helix-helix transcriptional regulator